MTVAARADQSVSIHSKLPFAARMQRLVATLAAQQAEGARLDEAIKENLRRLGL